MAPLGRLLALADCLAAAASAVAHGRVRGYDPAGRRLDDLQAGRLQALAQVLCQRAGLELGRRDLGLETFQIAQDILDFRRSPRFRLDLPPRIDCTDIRKPRRDIECGIVGPILFAAGRR
jgi:hypothetical protein